MTERSDNWVLEPADLLAWRTRLGLNQTEAAELLGVVQRTVSGWEQGQCRIPLTVAYAIRWLSETGSKDDQTTHTGQVAELAREPHPEDNE